jgi:lysophospholipase L1-like esterase
MINRAKRNPFFTFPLLFISLTLSLIAGEILVRQSGKCQTHAERNGKKYLSFYAEPPNGTWYWLRAPNDTSSYQQPEFDYTVITNSLGLRGPEMPQEKAENERRIIALGDSFTEGMGAEYENAYPQWLEKILNEKTAAPHIRVINAGISGSDPFYSYTLLRDKLLPYKPNLVTVAINASDVKDLLTRGGDERFLKNGRVQFAEPPQDEWLFARSHLYRLIKGVFGYDWFGLNPSEQIAKKEKAVDDLNAVLGKFKALALKKNFVLIAILHPANQHEAFEQNYRFDAASSSIIGKKITSVMSICCRRLPKSPAGECRKCSGTIGRKTCTTMPEATKFLPRALRRIFSTTS